LSLNFKEPKKKKEKKKQKQKQKQRKKKKKFKEPNKKYIIILIQGLLVF
jgi:hypothetical protein